MKIWLIFWQRVELKSLRPCRVIQKIMLKNKEGVVCLANPLRLY